MAKLATLEIVGTPWTCSTSLRVRGQVVGATVQIYRVGNSDPVASGKAVWPEQAFSLSTDLVGGQKVYAVQTLAGSEKSDNSEEVTVQELPTAAALSIGAFLKPFYECGQCVWLYDLWPGATAEVFAGSTMLGKAVANEVGEARVFLETRALEATDVLKAKINVKCQGQSLKSSEDIAGGHAVVKPQSISAPSFLPPLACDRFVQVTNIFPGATVTVERGSSNNPLFDECWPGSLLLLNLATELEADDILTVSQKLVTRTCDLHSKPFTTAVKEQLPETPYLAPRCAGDKDVSMSLLRPGATVELTIDNETILLGAYGDSLSLEVDPLVAGTVIKARQNSCGDDKSWSDLAVRNVQSSKMKVPEPKKPMEGIEVTDLTPTLIWDELGDSCSKAHEYHAQLATALDFAPDHIVDESDTVPDVTWTVTKLKAGHVYYWRVMGRRDDAETTWSEPAWFQTVSAERGREEGRRRDPGSTKKVWCFVEECSPPSSYSIKTVHSSPNLTQSEAYAEVQANAPECYIYPVPVSCDWKPERGKPLP